ncbi:MAG: hypothetical protein AAB497_03095 [Patescibacteria group bacterium]
MPFFIFAQTQTQDEIDAAYQEALKDPRMQDALKLREEADAIMLDAEKYKKDLSDFVDERTKQILTPEEVQKKVLSDYLDVKVSPQNPGPNEQITITIESYLADLRKATIKWLVNGKVASQGLGQTVFRFQNGSSGKTTSVSVSIVTNTGDAIERGFSFTPVGVAILWEASTYTPPFYKGKALMVPQAQVRVAAVPDIGSATNPFGAGNLVYTWEKNGLVHEGSSGFGKNVFSFTGPTPFNGIDVRVRVSSLDDTMNSEMRVSVPLSRPFILFYEKHPLLGVLYNKPLSDKFTLDKQEFSISAEPFFFSNEESEYSTIRYNWAVNGNTVQSSGRTLTFRNDTGAKGESAVSLSMRGIKQTSQSASRDLKVRLGEESSERPTF